MASVGAVGSGNAGGGVERMDRFAGRLALVTGGASGIGFTVAQRIVAEGGRACLWDLDRDYGIEEWRRVIDGQGGESQCGGLQCVEGRATY